MGIKEQTGAVCRTLAGVMRKSYLVGLGVTAVVMENISDVVTNIVENSSTFSNDLVTRGEETSREINSTIAARRQEIRQRAQANGHVKENE